MSLADPVDPVTVPLLTEDQGVLIFDEEALKRILDPEKLKELPIAVISIAGAFRMGKSLMLDFILRYLQEKGWQCKDDGSWLDGWSSNNDSGIRWKAGAEGDTRGILVLKEPIIVERSNGKKLAVLLLDTQGNFDHGRSREENVGIFALSTLFSSLQIFNISKQIQTNDLDYLQCFVEFSKVSHPKKSSDVDNGNADHQKCFFQDLLFLVRDWPHPSSHTYGIEGGKTCLKSLSRSGPDNSAHKYLNLAFSKIRCFLMPEPSKKVRTPETEHPKLEASNLGKSFSSCLTKFVDEFIHPDVLEPKTLGFAGPVTANVLADHVKCCAVKILSGGSPEFPSLMKLIASNAKTKAAQEVEKKFIDDVKEVIKSMEEPLWREFETVKEAKYEEAKKSFLDKTSFGRGEVQSDELEFFYYRMQSASSIVTTHMQERRCSVMKKEIEELLTESEELLKFRQIPYTEIQKLKEIRDKRLKLMPKMDAKDSSFVETLLQEAEERLNACYNENVRQAQSRNEKVSEIEKWLKESKKCLLNIMQFPPTDLQKLDKIRNDRLKLVPKMDIDNPDPVRILLQKAKDDLNACYNENVRVARDRNEKVLEIEAWFNESIRPLEDERIGSSETFGKIPFLRFTDRQKLEKIRKECFKLKPKMDIDNPGPVLIVLERAERDLNAFYDKRASDALGQNIRNGVIVGAVAVVAGPVAVAAAPVETAACAGMAAIGGICAFVAKKLS